MIYYYDGDTFQWVDAAAGAVGSQGATGAQGAVGPQGADGSQGTQGIQGVQGTTGSQGTTGETGAQGSTGAQGVQGTTGAQGITGQTGAQGATGAQGTSGTNGSQGTTGSQGATGTQGTVGAQGTTGAQGVQGTSGASILGLNNTFTGTNAFTSATFNAATSTVILKQNSSGSYAGLRIYNDQDSAVRALEIDYSGSSYSGSLITGGPAGESAAITTTGAYPLVLGTSNTARLIISSSGSVGIGTASPSKLLEVNKNLATNTVGSGEVLRLIGDDGNNVSRVTEIGFGTGPTGGVYSPVLIGAVVTSASGYNTKDLYFATRSGTADSVATERMRITSTGNVITSAGSAISYGAGTTYMVWTDEPEYSIADSSADSNYKTMKTFVASKSGSFNFKFSGYIQSGTYYWAWRLLKNSVTVASSGNYGSGLDTGQVAEVHAYRRFAGTVSSVTPGDIFELQMVSSDGSGNPSVGNGQVLYAKEFRIYSTTPSLDHGGSTNVFGNQVGIGITAPGAPLEIYKEAFNADVTGGGIILSRFTASLNGSYRGAAIYNRYISAGSSEDCLAFAVSSGSNPYTDFTKVKMVITDGGNVLVGTTSAYVSSRFRVQSSGTSSGTYNTELENSAGTVLFAVRDDGYTQTGVAAASPYNATTASAANCMIYSDGGLYRSTSSRKYKRDITDYTRGLADVLKLRPVFYKGKSENDGDTQFAGLIAEEVADAGLDEFVVKAADGTADALAYSNMVALTVKAIQELKADNDALRARVAALELN
jgi:hypothetical protein